MARLHAPLVAGAIATGALSVAFLGGAAQAADPTCPAGSQPVGGSCVAVLGTETTAPASTATTNPAGTVTAPAPATESSTNVEGLTITQPNNGGTGGLPFTGADVVPLVALGGVLLAGGTGFVLVGSRRRRPQHH